MSQIPNFCRSCGNRLEPLDRVYCSKVWCQSHARAAALQSVAIRTGETVILMPKERLLKMLEEDSRKYSPEGVTPDIGYMTSYSILIEKVMKHPWDDCSKFLIECTRIKELI